MIAAASAPTSYKFNCGILESYNGFKLKKIEPDEQGFYTVPVGCIGIPTRGNVIYEPNSLLKAMNDPKGRFNICLRDGNLCGEYGHPVIEGKEDMPRLFRIDEHHISHYFGAIWTDKPFTFNGETAIPIMAKVKPTGPKGKILKEQLDDPNHNTSFSIRTLCLPVDGPRRDMSYREVQMIITFDAVHAPGYATTSKRYAHGMESWETDMSHTDISKSSQSVPGMEATHMFDNYRYEEMLKRNEFNVGNLVGRQILPGNNILIDTGEVRSAAALLYGRK